ncbi:MAG: DUF4337 domain-containing protein [Acidobacteriota bacterium]
MEVQELSEATEHAYGQTGRTVGLTMAVVAALLASVTLMGHRLHTEETVQQTKAADGWAFFQAKNNRSHMYAADAKLAELIGPQGASVAKEWRLKAEEEKREADGVRVENEKLDEDTHAIARRATFFDASEICLEIAIVLCSIALLTGSQIFWKISFAGTAIGMVVAVIGFLR